MAEAMQKKQDKMENASVDRIASISHRIREAIRAALPAPPEQFFHVMVPGKVLNFSDFTEGFDENGNQTTPVLPNVTELNQAILCDDMPALASIQLGPTGRSVSRSYGATLSKLVPTGTTVGVEVSDPNSLSDAEKRYNRAMQWLLTEDDRNPGKTHLDTYIGKQKLYTEAEERKIKIFDAAYQRAIQNPINKTVAQQRAAYDKWVSENARKLRNDVEGAYKDWVIHGRKEAVEYWFAVVDNDSAMARVEQSKESMRNNTVVDSDGSIAFPKVRLTPSNWARIAQQKMKSGTDGTKTVAQYTWEISRLQKKNRMLEVLKESPPQLKGPDGESPKVPDTKDADEPVRAASKAYVEKSTALDNIRRKRGAKKEEIEKASKDAADAKENLDNEYAKYDKANIERLGAINLVALDELYKKSVTELDSEIKQNEAKIVELESERRKLVAANIGNPSDALIKDAVPSATSDADAGGAPPTGAVTKGSTANPTASNTVDYFTPITVEVSSSYQSTSASQHSTSVSTSVNARFGLFSGGGSASHSNSSADAASQMASSDVKVSFECMRVDIDRSWLRPELFYDEDLRAAPGAYISPGPMKLAALMDPDSNELGAKIGQKEREEELERYSTFPIYPTAFLLACNTILEISGETSAIQSHFDTSTTTAKASVGYGPFSCSVSAAHSDQHSSSTCETTANGCRITIKSPQIIGWISEMVPALPRSSDAPTSASTGTTPIAVTLSASTVSATHKDVPASSEDASVAAPPGKEKSV